MTSSVQRSPAAEMILAQLLSVGTWTACAVIAVGLVAQLTGYAGIGTRINRAGIGLLILLPVVRLITLAIAFARARERRFAGICLLVIVIIAAGTVAAMAVKS